ncbi:MAG: ParA family protein [Chthoniobacterales bacterium]
MIEVAFVNRKGGPGKTTMAILAALGLHEKGLKVGAHDQDSEQGTLGNSLYGSPIVVDPADPQDLDFLIVDTPPHFSSAWDATVARADLVVLVTTMYSPELIETRNTYERLASLACTQKTVILYNKFRANTKSGSRDPRDTTDKVAGPGAVFFDFVVPFREVFPNIHTIPWTDLGDGNLPLRRIMQRVLGRDGQDACNAADRLAWAITQHFLRLHAQPKGRGINAPPSS